MDALRQSILRAQLAKPLPGVRAAAASKPPTARAGDPAAIDARFAALDGKLDALIHMLKLPGKSHNAAYDLLPTDVRRAVRHFFGVTDAALNARGRAGRNARIRQIAFYLCRMHTTRSFAEIGQAFHRDHSTILHGVCRIGALRRTDAALDDDLSKLEARLADMRARRSAASNQAGR